MTKTQIKKIIKEYGYTMITPSLYNGHDGCWLFYAFDSNGQCYRFWIDECCEYATKQVLSDICILDEQLISRWFF